MEREALPEGGGGFASSAVVDVSKLGDGQENSRGASTVRSETKNAKKCRKRYWSNPEKARRRANEWWAKNRERALARKRELHAKNRDHIRAYRKKYMRAYYLKHKKTLLLECKERYQKNKERIAARNKAMLPQIRARVRARKASDPQFRIKEASRCLVSQALRRAMVQKRESTFYLIGCSPSFLKEYLEAQFNRMMNWSNYGDYWEIDHIIPISKFDLRDEAQRRQAFHYSNCRPLEVLSNRLKRNYLIGPHQPLLL